MGNVFSAIFGGSKKPTVDTSAADAVEADKKRKRRSKVALTSTDGGVTGEELQTGQVTSGSGTLYGN